MVATLATDELQCTELLTSCAEPSVNVPSAENDWVNPDAMTVLEGLTTIETMEAGVTVSTVSPVIPPKVAVI